MVAVLVASHGIPYLSVSIACITFTKQIRRFAGKTTSKCIWRWAQVVLQIKTLWGAKHYLLALNLKPFPFQHHFELNPCALTHWRNNAS